MGSHETFLPGLKKVVQSTSYEVGRIHVPYSIHYNHLSQVISVLHLACQPWRVEYSV